MVGNKGDTGVHFVRAIGKQRYPGAQFFLAELHWYEFVTRMITIRLTFVRAFFLCVNKSDPRKWLAPGFFAMPSFVGRQEKHPCKMFERKAAGL